MSPPPPKFLLTSFDTWRSHQVSNASDDLLAALADRRALPSPCILLRKLPVDFDRAPRRVLAALADERPDFLLCCGMAEGRSRLNLERYGRSGDDRRETPLDLVALQAGDREWGLSEDAGDFACNALYYAVLRDIEDRRCGTRALFVHVPVLTDANREAAIAGFVRLLDRLRSPQFWP